MVVVPEVRIRARTDLTGRIKGSRRQGVVRPFVPQIAGRSPPELPIHQRHQVIPGLEVTGAPRPQQTGHDARSIRHLGLSFSRRPLWTPPP